MTAAPGRLRPAETATPKRFLSGTHRLRDPRETLALVEPLLAGAGITRVADVTGLDHIGIPVMLACRPNARSLSVAQGKGLTRDAARASAVMEAIEGHHAETIDVPVRLCSHRQLARHHEVADPAALPRPRRSAFGPDARIPWIEGRGVASARPVWLPLEVVDLDFRVPRAYAWHHFCSSSNGLASGNHPLEALVHGLCEVIERDAEALWSLRPDRDSTRVDPGTVDDPDCRLLLEQFASADVGVDIWDATSDIGVATFIVHIDDRSPHRVRRVAGAGGSGTHPDRGIALLRALTEAAQSRLTMIAGSRDDLRRAGYHEPRASDAPEQERAGRERDAARRSFQDVPPQWNATFDADLAFLLERLAARGLPEPLVVDLAPARSPVAVVKVVAPGLEADPGIGARPGERAVRASIAAAVGA